MLDKRFNHTEKESELYELWEKSGYFHPETCIEEGICDENAEVFSMVLPPPNVTGTLHVGHAYMLALEDMMTRYNRMRGKRTLWIPGTDHAAIATQSKVEAQIWENEGKNRHDLGREEFLKRVKKYAQNSHDTIVNQIKRMGCSLDWEREAYTLDEAREKAVRTAFKKMYDEGLIYRGERIVNWDPEMKSTVSDDEVEYEEEKSPLYYIKYGPFTVATVRPETIFGDTGIAVNPDDERYKEYIGKEVEVDLLAEKRKLKVIGDEHVDPEFGTGAIKITPAHDPNDFDIWQRHEDKIGAPIQAIGEEGKLTEVAGEYAGMPALEAREKVAKDLKEKGLIEDIDENYTNKVAVNYRGGGRIEPLIKKQWFVDVDKEFILPNSKIKGINAGEKTTLKKLMRTTVESGQIQIVPDHFKKTYFNWVNNLRDWCISRQIWYGHRIPVWYKNKSEIQNSKSETNSKFKIQNSKQEEVYVGTEEPKGEGWEQDPDTLDTWFSSGLWTFSTLGWPEETKDLEVYHPTSILETGHDILFFWVARMILMTGFLLEDIPFETIYLHGLVRDEKNRKMSKSLNNIINPIDVIEEYGTDALRMTLITGATAGRDVPISYDTIRGYRNFATKLWNITRFLLMNLKDYDPEDAATYTEEDKNLMEEFDSVIKEVTDNMERYRYAQAGEVLHNYTWHTFADKIVENSKELLNGENQTEKSSRQHTLLYIWKNTIKALHPFMPFVTEELYKHLPPEDKNLLMVEEWPA